jgi:hypothetical protein
MKTLSNGTILVAHFRKRPSTSKLKDMPFIQRKSKTSNHPTIWFALRHNINLQRVNMVAISGLSLDFVTLDNGFGVSHLFSCTVILK